MRILIDNGHGRETSGKCSPVWPTIGQLQEWIYTRELAVRLELALNREQIPVQRIVPEDRDIPLWERVLRVNRIALRHGTANCLLVSLHVNASADGKARGWQIHTSLKHTLSDDYATIFWEEARKRLKGKTKMRQDLSDGEPDWDSNFAILRDTLCPAVLTENLFMDQPDDCRFLLSYEGREAIVDLHLSAIKRIVKLSKENKQP